MTVLAIDIQTITELATQVAQSGAIHTAEKVAENLFEGAIGIAVLIHQAI